jgi:stalled ribosome rescue protein Dom34
MSEYRDVIVFIDREEAKVFHMTAKDEMKLLFAHTAAQRRHHRADHEDGTKRAVDDEFMQRIASSLDLSGNTLICGPGNSKYELQAYLQHHTPMLAERVSGVEDLDDPKDSGILAIGRQFFAQRGHRHEIRPKESARNLDVPFKS